MSVLDFIDQSNECDSRDKLIKLFQDEVIGFGIDKFIYSLARGSFRTNGKSYHHGLARSYPEEWVERYRQAGYIDHDPTYRHALTTKGAFSWADLTRQIAFSKKEQTMMNEAREFGVLNGITLSIHGPYGEVFGFGFGCGDRKEGFSRKELSALYAISNQFHMSYTDFDEKTQFPQIMLSDRQREVLQWAAVGKSRSVIAEIMNISEDTVDDHFRHIFKKLECHDKTLAVLKAIYLGLIRI